MFGDEIDLKKNEGRAGKIYIMYDGMGKERRGEERRESIPHVMEREL